MVGTEIANVVFVIEGTSACGAYLQDLKSSYILPTLEFFNGGPLQETEYGSEYNYNLYGVVTFDSSESMLSSITSSCGPYSSIDKVMNAIESLPKTSGGNDSLSHQVEGLACAVKYFEDLDMMRDSSVYINKFCVLICNSSPYQLPVSSCFKYRGSTMHQISSYILEMGINLSVISPRKIPSLLKLYERCGGDLMSAQAKNYARDPRHLVLLKGYSLQERPVSPLVSQTLSSATTHLAMNNPATSAAPAVSQTTSMSNMNVTSPGAANSPGMFRSQVPTQLTSNQAATTHSMMPINRNPAPQTTVPANRWAVNQPQQLQQSQGTNQNIQISQSVPITMSAQPQQHQSHLVTQLSQLSPSSIQMNNQGQMGVAPAAQNSMVGTSNSQMVQQVIPNQQYAEKPQPQQVPLANQQKLLGVAPQRHVIWEGTLEWYEKARTAGETKIPRQVPCRVTSTSTATGEPEVKAESWPSKLVMQLIPKQVMNTLGSQHFRYARSVLFHFTSSEALEFLTRVMTTGYAGAVHFTAQPGLPPCDIKVLMLLYIHEKQSYLGFIPNDQGAFVDRIRKVIVQQKQQQQQQNIRQNIQLPASGMTAAAVPATGNQNLSAQNTSVSVGAINIQNPPQNAMISQSTPQLPGNNFHNLQAEMQRNKQLQYQLRQSLEAAQQREQQLKHAQGYRGQTPNTTGSNWNEEGAKLGEQAQPKIVSQGWVTRQQGGQAQILQGQDQQQFRSQLQQQLRQQPLPSGMGQRMISQQGQQIPQVLQQQQYQQQILLQGQQQPQAQIQIGSQPQTVQLQLQDDANMQNIIDLLK